MSGRLPLLTLVALAVLALGLVGRLGSPESDAPATGPAESQPYSSPDAQPDVVQRDVAQRGALVTIGSGNADAFRDLKAVVWDHDAARDDAAGAILDRLLVSVRAEPPDAMGLQDRDAFLAVLRDLFTNARPRAPEKRLIYEQAAFACQYLGAGGAKVLEDAFGADRFSKKEWLEQRASFVRYLGKTKDETTIELLVDLATRSPDDQILEAAGEALGNYEGLPLQKRRPIAKELIKRLNEVHDAAERSLDPADDQARASRETRHAILGTWSETLRKLTHQRIEHAPWWKEWFFENKHADWDALPARR